MRLIRLATVALLSLAFTMLPAYCMAATQVGGNITTNTTWTLAQSPYEVTETVYISSSARLTIEPGVDIRFNTSTALWIGHPDSDASSTYRGNLTANGTSDLPITFTSANGFAGGWEGIIFGPRSDDYASSTMTWCSVENTGEVGQLGYSAGVILNYTGASGAVSFADTTISNSTGAGLHAVYSTINLTNVEFTGNRDSGLLGSHSTANISGGSSSKNDSNGFHFISSGGAVSGVTASGNAFDGLLAEGGSIMSITDSTFSNNDGYGLHALDFDNPLTVSGVTFDGNSGYPARVSAKGSFHDNVFLNSQKEGIELLGGSIDSGTPQWSHPGTGDYHPYIHLGLTRLLFSRTLTVGPGVTVEFMTGGGLEIAHPTSQGTSDYRGGLNVQGTEAEPVLFTSHSGSAGGWMGVFLGPMSDDTVNVIASHLTIEKAGEPNTLGHSANLTINGAGGNGSSFTNCNFTNSTGQGVRAYIARLAMTGGAVSGNGTEGILLEATTTEIDGVNISSNAGDGVNIQNSGGFVTGCVLSDNGGHGASIGACTIEFSGNSISANGGYGIDLDLLGDATVTDNTLSDNSFAGIRLAGGGIASSLDLYAQHGEPFFTVKGPPIFIRFSRELTIHPGATLFFDAGTGIWVGHPQSDATSDYRGKLTAVGTADNPILFTSLSGEPGGWQGIIFGPRSDDMVTSALQHSVVEYGGESNFNGKAANLHFTYSGTNTTLANLTSRGSTGDGILMEYSNLTIPGLIAGGNWEAGISALSSTLSLSSSLLLGNGGSAIVLESSQGDITDSYIFQNAGGVNCEAAGSADISASVIKNNTFYGVDASQASYTVNAENNYWGARTGPFDPSDDTDAGGLYNPGGSGGNVTDRVDYDPWDFAPADSDSDGLPDSVEATTLTDPFDADSDDDTIPDGEEIEAGTDPNVYDAPTTTPSSGGGGGCFISVLN